MKVRGKGINPYGICYKSVLKGQKPPLLTGHCLYC